jgi:hypothetical protein
MSLFHLAQAMIAAAPQTFDFTPVVVAIVGGVFSVIGIIATTLINSKLKNANDAATLDRALTNSLGAVKIAVDAGLQQHPLQATVSTTPEVAAGIQYVLNNAGDEAARLGVTPAALASKIETRIGLQKSVATATAVAAKAAA